MSPARIVGEKTYIGCQIAQIAATRDASPRIAVIDYGMGNRRSVEKALEHVGADASITRDHDELRAAEGLVLPGVGAFPLAMRNLNELGLADLIGQRVAEGTPLLGICLGMQLLLESSEELEPTPGLALIPGEVTSLATDGPRVPHIGWNEVRFERRSPLTAGLPVGGCAFYHVHSFAPRPRDAADVVGTTEYGERFATIVERGHVFGVQFHPEKSSGDGLRLLESFVALCAGKRQLSSQRVGEKPENTAGFSPTLPAAGGRAAQGPAAEGGRTGAHGTALRA
jgi:glutamine amidotransferase